MIRRKIRPDGKKYLIYMSVVTALAGFVNGFIGTGGGMILYFALKYGEKFGGEEIGIKDRLAGIIVTVIPISAVSAVVYLINGNVELRALMIYIPMGAAGGFLGALCLQRIKPNIIRKIFAAFLIIGGVRMLIP